MECAQPAVRPPKRTVWNSDTKLLSRCVQGCPRFLDYPRRHMWGQSCAELRHLRQLLAESYPVTELVKQALLHTRWGRELIRLARNLVSGDECLSQNFPLSRFLLPRIHGHKFRVWNVITRIFVAGRVVCTRICHDSSVARNPYLDILNFDARLNVRVGLSNS